mmetsp:Transcript_4108/g.8126  ORF Transcript_4108/g.8126 Transcript_4108/m.8126 type:complete len:135 (-) Transcript_4108:1147-1551(-)
MFCNCSFFFSLATVVADVMACAECRRAKTKCTPSVQVPSRCKQCVKRETKYVVPKSKPGKRSDLKHRRCIVRSASSAATPPIHRQPVSLPLTSPQVPMVSAHNYPKKSILSQILLKIHIKRCCQNQNPNPGNLS